jgi:predicted Rossmann-fold nucleotide-binding protein
MTRRLVEIDSLAAFDDHVAGGVRMSGWVVQSLDLTDRSEALVASEPRGAVFLGCHFAPAVEAELRHRGALLFPRLPDLPFDPYRPGLYDAAALYGAGTYADSPDAAIYSWSRAQVPAPLAHTLAATLHDHAVTDALDDATAGIDGSRLVGVMGGHALRRGEPAYAAAAELGAQLTNAGRTVLTGGGPGAMEAANLGAYLSPWPEALGPALELLATAPTYGDGVNCLSIPTWFYGHEPTNVFATGIAKYFANALREDTLLHRCRGGIVYLPGQAGTVQEIFQAVTENFYAADASLVAPMVLVGVEYWTTVYPAWPLLQRLAAGRPMGTVVHCVDTVEEAAGLLA